jgi:SAM-dependent methyltransferase
MNPTDLSLLAQSRTICASTEFKTALLAWCPQLHGKINAGDLSTTIHSNDQMFTHSLHQHQDAGAAQSQYFNISLQQFSAMQQIQQHLFGNNHDDTSVVDFACGYGRLLRFLSLAMPHGKLFASELQADALVFVAHEFGVTGLPSHADPEQFQPARKFDFIWVASLFSHLPESLFDAWLARLIDVLTPNGLLCFSVRDSSLLAGNTHMPESGIVYETRSENADLDTDIYGTAYASETFVAQSLRRALGHEQQYFRLRKALAQEQICTSSRKILRAIFPDCATSVVVRQVGSMCERFHHPVNCVCRAGPDRSTTALWTASRLLSTGYCIVVRSM